MSVSTLYESTAEHPAPDVATDTLVPSHENYTVACPAQNKENKNKEQKTKRKTCSDRWLPSCPVSFLQKFQMRHLAPGGGGSDNFFNLFFFGGGGGNHMAFGGNRDGYLGGVKEI